MGINLNTGQLILRLNVLAVCLCIGMVLHAQTQPVKPITNLSADYLFKAIDKMQKEYDKGDTTQAFITLNTTETWLKKNNAYKELLASTFYNLAGNLFERSSNSQKAHDYFTLALKNARKYNNAFESKEALHSLIILHEKIGAKNLNFKYAPVNETEEEYVYFQIEKIETIADSLILTIYAGLNDGIVRETTTAEAFTSVNPKDTLLHKDISFYGKGRIITLAANRTLLKVPVYDKMKLLPGDMINIKVNVPIAWRKLNFREFLLENLYLANNYREKLFHYRYFYYFPDDQLEAGVLSQMKDAVDEVAGMLSDPESAKAYPQKSESGIFAGKTMITALKETKPDDITYYLNFLKQFPVKYIANNYKLSETYATWVINNTPLNPKDIAPFILNFSTAALRQQKAFDFKSQIKSDQLIDKWLNDGMQQVDIEDIQSARRSALLLNDATYGLNDDFNSGWADYLNANIEKRLTNDSLAFSYLAQARTKFEKANNAEGLSWSGSTAELWKKTNKVNVGIQSGHFFTYKIARSPNPRYYATGSSDQLIKIWDTRLGKEINTITTHNGAINDLTYSANGRYLASTSDDSITNIFNAYNYALLYSFKNKSPESTVRFSPDNKYIVSGGEDAEIKFINIATGVTEKVLKKHTGRITGLAFHPLNSNLLYSSATDSMVYCWNIERGEMVRWYKHGGKALSVKITNNGKFMSVVSTDTLLSLWNLNTSKSLKYKISMHKVFNTNYFAEEGFSPDSRYMAYPEKGNSFIIMDLLDFSGMRYNTMASGNDLEELNFSNDGLSLYARFFSYGVLRTYNFAGWTASGNSTMRFKEQRQYSNVVFAAQFTKDDNNVVVVEAQFSKIDLQTGKKTFMADGNMGILNRKLLLGNDDLISYFDIAKKNLVLFDYKKQQIVKQIEFSNDEKISAIAWSKDVKYVFLGGFNGTLNGYEVGGNKKLFSKKLTGADQLYVIEPDDVRNRILVAKENVILLLDWTSGEVSDSVNVKSPTYISATSKWIFVTTADGFLNKYDAVSLQLVKRQQINEKGMPAGQILQTQDQKSLLIINAPRSVMRYNIEEEKPVYIIPDQDQETLILTLNHSGDTFATGSLNGALYLFETSTGKRKVSIFMPLDKDIMITDADQHYMTAKNTLDAIQFTYNNNAYSFDQFDVQLNRPDIVLKAIGRADSTIINAYYNAYLKRIKKLNIQPSNTGIDVHLPRVQLENRFAVPPVTQLNEYELTITCSDTRYNLQTLQVLVNNVPLLGLNGLDLRSLNTKQTTRKIKIPLSVDNNIIKVFCTNSTGAMSLKESFDVISKYKTDKPKFYFIGIGVASYKDTRMNLKYSVKDIRDLAKTFKGIYPDAIIDTLIDGKATKEAIIALKKKLLKTTINDRVILAVTGHGLLSKSLDFYFGTWDVNFKQPELRGIKYEALEDLLSGIPARQKLMLIDACHSGALDKEELLAIKADELPKVTDTLGKVKLFAARGIEEENSGQKINANSTFELMQNQFTDLSAGSGAIIISAAGGMEFAFESPKWNNGVFTYCVRKGIEERQADYDGGNYDGSISVQELLNYVGKKVEALTNGRQRPTSRRENIDYEWKIR